MARAWSVWERKGIVAAWRKSGKSAQAFAAAHGVSISSLFRWARETETKSAAGAVETPKLRLVEAVPSPRTVEWEWELEAPAGILRGRREIEKDALRVIVDALFDTRGKR